MNFTEKARRKKIAKKKSIEELIEKELKPQVFNLKEKLSAYKDAIECQKEIDFINKKGLNNLFKTYDERIFSRLVGYYSICRFFGEDLRYKK